MERAEFDRLVGRIEEMAARSPLGYKARVGLLALLGYGYIFAVLAALAAILVLLGYAALGQALGVAVMGVAIGFLGYTVSILAFAAGFAALGMWMRRNLHRLS